MKKILILLVILALALAIPAAALAGERSNILSEEELVIIETVAMKAYSSKTRIYMVVDQEFFERFTIIKFIREDHSVSLLIEVYAHRARMDKAEGDKVGERVGVKVIEVIEKILNEKPRVALRNIMD